MNTSQHSDTTFPLRIGPKHPAGNLCTIVACLPIAHTTISSRTIPKKEKQNTTFIIFTTAKAKLNSYLITNRASSSCTSTSPIAGRSFGSNIKHLFVISINTSQHSGAIFPLRFGSIFSSTGFGHVIFEEAMLQIVTRDKQPSQADAILPKIC
ncbi:hypothetical protein CR513_24572, partial [Mucuna pruriens]